MSKSTLLGVAACFVSSVFFSFIENQRSKKSASLKHFFSVLDARTLLPCSSKKDASVEKEGSVATEKSIRWKGLGFTPVFTRFYSLSKCEQLHKVMESTKSKQVT